MQEADLQKDIARYREELLALAARRPPQAATEREGQPASTPEGAGGPRGEATAADDAREPEECPPLEALEMEAAIAPEGAGRPYDEAAAPGDAREPEECPPPEAPEMEAAIAPEGAGGPYDEAAVPDDARGPEKCPPPEASEMEAAIAPEGAGGPREEAAAPGDAQTGAEGQAGAGGASPAPQGCAPEGEMPEEVKAAREQADAEGAQPYGQLWVRVVTAHGLQPVKGALVTVSLVGQQLQTLLKSLYSDNEGRAGCEVPLTRTAGGRPCAYCHIRVDKPGYFTCHAYRVPVYEGEPASQCARLLPLPGGAGRAGQIPRL